MIIGLLGTNGAGKTTYLRRISAGNPAAYLPDFPNIPVELSAIELITRVGRMQKLPDAESRARALVRQLSIVGGMDRPVSTYSAGNFKKTALALVLLNPGQELFLDEPLETVDMFSRAVVTRIFQALSARGCTIYISSQDVAAAMEFDEVKVFSDCRIVAEGRPGDVLGVHPLERFVELTGYIAPSEELEWLR